MQVDARPGFPPDGGLMSPFDKQTGMILYDIDDISENRILFINECKKTEIGFVWDCIVHWKNGTRTEVTPDFDIGILYKELE